MLHFDPHPHTAASTSKATAIAFAVADALVEHNHNVPQALDAWEPEQLAYGLHLMKQGQFLAFRSQFTYGTSRFGENATPLQQSYKEPNFTS